MIPVYNCASFLPDALASVLAQDPGADLMQIEVVDDCSTDADVEALVKQMGQGRITYFRQPQNVGSLRNFETCINRAKGRLVHLLHGDDRVKPGFYNKIKSLFETYPDAGAAFCRYNFINGKGEVVLEWLKEEEQDCILPNWLLRIGEMQRIQYAAMVVKREVYEKLGSFYGMSYAEDWEMWVRIAKHYPVAYSPELLADYRVHGNSISSTKVSDGKVIADYLNAIHFIQRHIPEHQKKRLLKRAMVDCAYFNINRAHLLWKEERNSSLVWPELKQALRISKHPKILYEAMKICAKTSLGIRTR